MIIEEIMDELAEILKIKLKEEYIRVEDDGDSIRLILDYLDNRERKISQKERKVIISKELDAKIRNREFNTTMKTADEIIDEFNHICRKISKGESLNFNLSKKIFDSREKYKDIIFNTWKIFHIHLSKNDVSSKSAMKKNRSSVLLFCIVNDDSVMCIDIVEHPSSNEVFGFSLMKIIKSNNWMEKIGFLCIDDSDYVSGTLKPIIEKDKDLTEIYTQYKVNLMFEFDGKLYCPLDGITGTGDTLHNVLCFQQFKKTLEKYIRQDDRFEKITDISFEESVMKFSIVITRKRKKIKYRCQI